jgi:hypothetical protein
MTFNHPRYVRRTHTRTCERSCLCEYLAFGAQGELAAATFTSKAGTLRTDSLISWSTAALLKKAGVQGLSVAGKCLERSDDGCTIHRIASVVVNYRVHGILYAGGYPMYSARKVQAFEFGHGAGRLFDGSEHTAQDRVSVWRPSQPEPASIIAAPSRRTRSQASF